MAPGSRDKSLLKRSPTWRAGSLASGALIRATTNIGGVAGPALLESSDGVADVLGMPFVVPSATQSPVSKRIMATGRTEPEFTSLLQRIIAPGARLIDVGANIGYFTCVMAQCAGAEGRVVALEPFARPRRYLEHNIEINGFTGVQIDGRALADWTGRGFLTLPAYRLERAPTTGGVADEVDVISMDMTAAEFGLDGLDLVKMDIEGSELRALEGMRGCITQWEPTLAIEVHPGFLPLYGDSVESLETFLRSVHYDWARVEPATNREPNYRIIAAPRARLEQWKLAPGGKAIATFALSGLDEWASPLKSQLEVTAGEVGLRIESLVPTGGHEYLLTHSYATESPPSPLHDAPLLGDAYAELEWDVTLEGSVGCMVWVLEYDQAQQVAKRSLSLTPGHHVERLLTHPRAQAYRLGLRFSGAGTVDLRQLDLTCWQAG